MYNTKFFEWKNEVINTHLIGKVYFLGGKIFIEDLRGDHVCKIEDKQIDEEMMSTLFYCFKWFLMEENEFEDCEFYFHFEMRLSEMKQEERKLQIQRQKNDQN